VTSVSRSSAKEVTDDQVVHVDVPCAARSLGLLRLAVVTVMSDAGATMSDMDAGRFAVSELASMAIESSQGAGRLSVTIRPQADQIEIEGRSTRSSRHTVASRFVADLLHSLTLTWSVSGSGTSFRFMATVPVNVAAS
jgi:hypothetical protein